MNHLTTRLTILLFVVLLVTACTGGPEPMTAIFDQEGNATLAPCPDSPNCVSTMETDELHGIEPLPFRGDATATMSALLTVVEQMKRTTIIKQTDSYLHVEYRTLLGFVDDVEFVLDGEREIVNFRSASRVGYGDMGVNRNRMEEFRSIYEGLPAS